MATLPLLDPYLLNRVINGIYIKIDQERKGELL